MTITVSEAVGIIATVFSFLNFMVAYGSLMYKIGRNSKQKNNRA